MGDPGYLDVDTGAVVGAGRATAGTADDWGSWGARSRAVFQIAGADVRSETLLAAIEDYAAGVVAGATRVGQQVHNLGTDTASAGVLVDSTDLEAAAQLQPSAPTLPRPVNGERVAA